MSSGGFFVVLVSALKRTLGHCQLLLLVDLVALHGAENALPLRPDGLCHGAERRDGERQGQEGETATAGTPPRRKAQQKSSRETNPSERGNAKGEREETLYRGEK